MASSNRDPGVLVFGGSRGIGAAVARAFTSAGRRVAIAARGVGDAGIVCDVAEADAVDRAFEQFGPVDVVVHAAAIQGGPGAAGPLWDTDPDAFDSVVRVNLSGAYHVLRRALIVLRAAGDRGAVMLFSGGGAAHPRPRFAAYGTTKAAVVRMVETAHVELREAGSGIGVYAVAPGAVRTAMTEEVATLGARAGDEAAAAADILAHGGVPPDEAAELCQFLATDAALPLSGRLVHVREAYREYVGRALTPDAGCLRRRDFPPASQ